MITIVVGAQYGGEGKGKVAAYLAWKERPSITCRCGGPNSSHSVLFEGVLFKLRMMPTAAVVNRKITVVFGAGTLIHIPTLRDEISKIGFKGSILVSPLAGVIATEYVEQQRSDKRYELIGSTLTGTGYASSARALRKLPLARDFHELKEYLFNVEEFLWDAIDNNKHVLVEGHQGYGLSNYHGDYPYVSSRDSTAAGMLSELALPINSKKIRVILAVKCFPTRNHNGYLAGEISQAEADSFGILEHGGGSWGIPNRRRRVGLFDDDLVRRAARANGATDIALTGADYLDSTLFGKQRLDGSTEVMKFSAFVEKVTSAKVSYISTGPDTKAMIDFRNNNKRLDAEQSSLLF
jgi:adenylosuccinate synthase